MKTSELRYWVRKTCEQNAVPDLAEKIKIEWSNRMTSSMGCAQRTRDGVYTIKLAAKLWCRATRPEQIETVVHETCHCIESVENNRMTHGQTWRQCMLRCGVYPRRCHTVDTTGLKIRWLYACDCGKHELSTRLHNSIKQGRSRHCKKCKGNLTFIRKK